MKILIISLHADPTSPAGIGEGGGTHSYVRELLTFFSNTDMEILLITRKSHPELLNYEEVSQNCKIQRIVIKDEYPIDKKELYAFHNISMQKVQYALEKCNFNPDLIHSVYWNSGQIAKELSDKLKIPYVHTVISNGLRRKLTGMDESLDQRYEVEKEIFHSATYIFCITPSERVDLVNLYQIDAKKIMVPGRPVSSDFLYPAHDDFGIPYRFKVNTEDIMTKSKIKLDCNLKSSNITNEWWSKRAFLYCGRIGTNKGVDIILKAWCCLKDTFNERCPALWIIGGNLDEIENLKASLSNRYNLKNYEEQGDLIWWGYLDQRGISTLMLKAHALIMHSSYEPGGRVIIEALSSGIPVISTSCGFGADYIYDWYNGFQVPYGDINFLYHVLSLFIKQPYLSNMLGLNAKNYMQKILKEWDFYKSHQVVYNAAIVDTTMNFEDTGLILPISFYKNYINIYPYFNSIITNDDLKLLLEEKLQKNNLQLASLHSENIALWITNIDSIEYEIWQPYTLLLDTAYYLPFIDIVVDKRNNIYERETHVSYLKITPILESIDSHYLFIKKKHTALEWQHLQATHIQQAIKNLLYEINTYDPTAISIELASFNQDWHNSNIDTIKEIYESYNQHTPTYFYHSHSINLSLSVRQLYFILADSSNIFSEDIVKLYTECKDFLNDIALENSSHYGECLEDCSLNNIVFDNNSGKCLFKSAATLYWGDTARMPADFLHSYLILFLSKNNDLKNLDKYIDEFLPYQHKFLCIGWLFVITFEKIALYLNTLQENNLKNEFTLLNKLKAMYIDNKKIS